MKRTNYKIILQILLVVLLVFACTNVVNAASAKISASATNVEVGDSVNINVSIDAITWNIKVDGSGISDSIIGGNLEDFTNKTTTKSYNLDTSKPGTYTVKLSGDVVDVNNGTYSDQNGSVTITVKEKKQETKTQTEETKTTEPEAPKQEEPKQEEPKQEEKQEEKPEEPKTEKQNENVQNTEPEVKFTDTSKTMYSTDSINVRSSYSTSSNAIGSLKQDDEVIVTGIASNGWTRIKYNGQTAYVSSQFLTDTKPKEKSKNNDLKSLKVSEGTLSPEFNKDVTSYKISVGKDVEKITVNAEVEDEKAKVEISGNEELKEGANNVKVIVTAESGDTKTYTISATREAKGKLQLASLDINGIKLNETFKPDKYEYTVTLANNSNTKKLDIKAKANDESATVEILGNENFVDGENVITIMVKSKDGKENVTYQIIVNKKAASSNTNTTTVSNNNKNNKNNDLFLYVAAGIFATALILIIIIIVRSIKKSKEDSDEDYDNEDELGIKNNYTEELYSTRNENDKAIDENKELSINKDNDNKLYDVEKEVDFSDKNVDEYDDMPKKKKGGKHSK